MSTNESLSRRDLLKGAVGTGAAVVAGAALVPVKGALAAPAVINRAATKTVTMITPAGGDVLSHFVQGLGSQIAGVKVVTQASSEPVMVSQTAAQTQAGNPPDVIFWASAEVADFLAAGVPLLDLGPYVKAHEPNGTFYQQDYESGTANGTIYALCVGIDPRGIVYRTDYAAQAGLKTPSSWTFDQFAAWAGKLSHHGHYGFGFEAKQNDPRFASNFMPLLWSTGGRFGVKKGGKWTVAFTPTQATKVLQFYYDIVYKTQGAPINSRNWGYPDTDGGFAKGVLASYSTGPFVRLVAAKYPKTLANTRVAPLPHDKTQTGFWSSWAIMIHKNAKNQDGALALLQALRSVKWQTALLNWTGNPWLSVRPSINKDITDPILKGFASVMPYQMVPEPLPQARVMSQVVVPALASVLYKRSTPQQAGQTMYQNMTNLLDQINSAG